MEARPGQLEVAHLAARRDYAFWIGVPLAQPARYARAELCDGGLQMDGRAVDLDAVQSWLVVYPNGEPLDSAGPTLPFPPGVTAGLAPSAAASVAPEEMSIAIAPAIRKLMKHHQLGLADVDLWELHEAYAVTTLYNQAQLETPWDLTNVNGGAVPLGHPYGMSGIRYLGSTLLELSHAARSVSALADYLERHPEALIRGKPADPK